MLCCIGDLVEDVVVWPAAPPQRGTDTAARIYRRRGGSAANVAVLAAAAGGRSRFIGQVGNDRLGRVLVEEMENLGVDMKVVRDGRTGTVVVLIESDGERTMLPDRGAATQLAAIPDGALDGAAWLHIPGYSLIVEPLTTTTQQLSDIARRRRIPVSVDASSVGLIKDFGVAAFRDTVTQLKPDVLFCNRDEADLLGLGAQQPFAGAGLTVIKAGAAPVLLVTADRSTTPVPVPAVAGVADTTGAGDAFAAGFLVATIAGADPITAAGAGNALAATVLTRPGAGEHEH